MCLCTRKTFENFLINSPKTLISYSLYYKNSRQCGPMQSLWTSHCTGPPQSSLFVSEPRVNMAGLVVYLMEVFNWKANAVITNKVMAINSSTKKHLHDMKIHKARASYYLRGSRMDQADFPKGDTVSGLGASYQWWEGHIWNLQIHPSIGTILCAERWCCLSSLLDSWAQSWTGRHSNAGYHQAGTHFSDLRRMTGRVRPTWY